tara:strand:- start:1010 stop:1387 length:378 start_codon:yes stop_codon:yes gene_type:complete
VEQKSISLAPQELLIQGYGDGGFTIGNQKFLGSICILSKCVNSWPIKNFIEIKISSFKEIIKQDAEIEILLIGCGSTSQKGIETINQSLLSHGIASEWMSTGAACRTFNVLLSERRAVAAALIAV